jgi:hypothetical protein
VDDSQEAIRFRSDFVHDFGGLVRAPIINGDYFEVWIVLFDQRTQTSLDIFLFVLSRDQHGDLRPGAF